MVPYNPFLTVLLIYRPRSHMPLLPGHVIHPRVDSGDGREVFSCTGFLPLWKVAFISFPLLPLFPLFFRSRQTFGSQTHRRLKQRLC